MSAQFYQGLGKFPKATTRNAIVTVGTFDGIHRGHQEIFTRLKDQASSSDAEPVLVTFHPHPKVVISPENAPLLLTTIEEKNKFIPHFFDGKVLILDFDNEMMAMEAEEFVKQILIDIVGLKKLIVGYDHGLGRNRSGGTDELKALGKKYDFELEIVDPVANGDKPVSSSRIRRAIADNEYRKALELLGHEYAIFGTVERGIGLGRKLGYPTANVKYNHRKLLPAEGVYACWVQVDGDEKNGMMFIGRNYFNPARKITVEANLFDFDRDIYDKEIYVYATHYVRGNMRFDVTDDLVKQLEIDKENVLRIIEKEHCYGDLKRKKSTNYS